MKGGGGRRRPLALLVLVASLLIFVNACDAERDSSEVFRSAEYAATSNLESIAAQRHADQLTHFELEGAALAFFALGTALLLVPKYLIP